MLRSIASRIRKPISIRWSLLRSFIVLILISSLTVLILMSIRAQRTEKELSEKLISRGTLQAAHELDRFFQPANKGVQMAVQWGIAGKLNLNEVVSSQPLMTTQFQLEAAAKINSLLIPYLLAHPEISSVQVANARGDGFLILLLASGRIRNRVVCRNVWGTQTLWFDVGRDGRPISSEWKNVDYDPRKRAWYTGVTDLWSGEVYWTEPYIFFTTKDLGITASARWNDSGMDYVIAYDVLLTAITEFTQHKSTQISKNSQTAIVTEDLRMVGLPRHKNFSDQRSIQRSFLHTINELKVPEFTAALKKAESKSVVDKAIFSFRSQGEDWWAGMSAYPLAKSRNLWIGILVPNKDLLEGVTEVRLYLLFATLVALTAALIYSLLLARSYSRPLEALAIQSHRIRDLDFQTDEKIEAKFREFKQLGEAQEQSLKALQSFARYVPIEVVQELVGKGEVARIGGRLKTLTILFTDIAGFTSISESMKPEALTYHMAEYFQAMIDILLKHGATVDKIVGDAIVAFWGAPTPIQEHAEKSVQAVLECSDKLEALNQKWRGEGLSSLPTRFGLATGPVVVGNIGALSRLSYTVLGDTVNLANRLESLNKVYGTKILVDENTRKACSDRYKWRHIDRIVVVGKTKPTDIFEVLGKAGKVSEKESEAAGRYEEAWNTYRSGDFIHTIELLEDFEKEFGRDAAVKRLRKKCEDYSKNPPKEGWDGTSKMTNK